MSKKRSRLKALRRNMTSNPTITVVIPTRNRCTLLKETVASIVAQSFTNWELLVIDDVSEDETSSWVNGLGDQRIRAIRLEQHSERSAARNRGLSLANGEFILFLDDDDPLTIAALQTHLEALTRYPGAIASVGGFIQFDERGNQQVTKIVGRRCVRHLWLEVLLGWSPACGQCLFRVSTIKTVQGWNTSYNICEDHELWLRLSRAGAAVLLPEVVYMYRVHAGQWRPPQRKIQQLLNEMRERAVAQLPERERQKAERILAARRQNRRAAEGYRNAEPMQALISYLQAIRLAPGILGSPVMRPKVLRRMIKCLPGGELIWRRRWATRKKLGLFSRTVVRSADGRTHWVAPETKNEQRLLAQHEDD